MRMSRNIDALEAANGLPWIMRCVAGRIGVKSCRNNNGARVGPVVPSSGVQLAAGPVGVS